jgi:hypothetical protein
VLNILVADDSNDWGDVSEDDIQSAGYSSADDIPAGLWISGVKDVTYTGSAVTFDDLHIYKDKKLLTEGVDYTVKYKNNTKAGTATVTVTGKGNYAGSVVEDYKIEAIDISAEGKLIVPDITLAYTGKAQKGTTTVIYRENGKDVTLKKDADYKFIYDNNDTYVTSGEHFVIVQGKGNYKGTVTFKETITGDKKLISKLKIRAIPAQTSDGAAVEPDVTITDAGYTLVRGKDYTLSYANNLNVGTGSVVITGIGDYAGTKVLTFKIKGLAINKAIVSGVSDRLFTGSKVTFNDLKVSYKFDGVNATLLQEGTDYTVIELSRCATARRG